MSDQYPTGDRKKDNRILAKACDEADVADMMDLIDELNEQVARLTAERDAAVAACGNYAQALVDTGSRLAKLEAVAEAAREVVPWIKDAETIAYTARTDRLGGLARALAAIAPKETT